MLESHMTLTPSHLLSTLLIGLGASLLMDAWNLFLKRAFGVASLNYCLLGRWIRHMPGRFVHEHIGKAEARSGECAVGWMAHYSIGVSFAVALVAWRSTAWLERPTLGPALVVGVATVVFPLFLMQPALGFGVAASRTPSPGKARLKSLGTHTVFGLGLYLSALALRMFS